MERTCRFGRLALPNWGKILDAHSSQEIFNKFEKLAPLGAGFTQIFHNLPAEVFIPLPFRRCCRRIALQCGVGQATESLLEAIQAEDRPAQRRVKDVALQK